MDYFIQIFLKTNNVYGPKIANNVQYEQII